VRLEDKRDSVEERMILAIDMTSLAKVSYEYQKAIETTFARFSPAPTNRGAVTGN
jgi:hypothetical protein